MLLIMECLLFNSWWRESLVLPHQGGVQTPMCSRGIFYLPGSENAKHKCRFCFHPTPKAQATTASLLLLLVAQDLSQPQVVKASVKGSEVSGPKCPATCYWGSATSFHLWTTTCKTRQENALLTVPNTV